MVAASGMSPTLTLTTFHVDVNPNTCQSSILFHVVTDDGGVTDLGAELGRRGKASTIRRGGGVVVTTGMFRMAPGRFQGNNEEEEELGEADEMGDLLRDELGANAEKFSPSGTKTIEKIVRRLMKQQSKQQSEDKDPGFHARCSVASKGVAPGALDCYVRPTHQYKGKIEQWWVVGRPP